MATPPIPSPFSLSSPKRIQSIPLQEIVNSVWEQRSTLLPSIDPEHVQVVLTTVLQHSQRQCATLSRADLLSQLDPFLQHLQLTLSQYSLDLHRKAVRSLVNFWGNDSRKHWPLTDTLIHTYREDLARNRRAPATIRAYLTALRRYLDWCVSEGFLRENPANNVRRPAIRNDRHRRHPLKLTNVQNILHVLLKHTDQDGPLDLTRPEIVEWATHASIKTLRNLAITYTMLKTGIRAIELVRANVGDIQETPNGTVLVIQGKGRDEKDNFVVLRPEVLDVLNWYLAQRLRQHAQTLDPIAPLFTVLTHYRYKASTQKQHHDDGRIQDRQIRRIILKLFKQAKVKTKLITGHSLRHTAATFAIQGRAPLTGVQSMLRSKTAKPATIYLQTSNRFQEGGEQYITQY